MSGEGYEQGDASEVHVAYCSACDRPVRVRVRPGFDESLPPTAHDIAHLICLEKGEGCTGALCPFSDEPEPPPDAAAGPSPDAA